MPYKKHKRKKKIITPAEKAHKDSVSKKVQESKERFLTVFIEAEGNISLAAEHAGIDRGTHYEWLEKDLEYATKFKIYQQGLEDREKQIFLLAYIKTGKMSIAKAAEMIGIDRGKHYKWLEDDEKYAAQFKKVKMQYYGDILEEEAFRRAVEGTLKPIFYEGKVCGFVNEYSDGLLAKMLAAYQPEKYREKQAEINVRNENHINLGLAERVKQARERAQRGKEGD